MSGTADLILPALVMFSWFDVSDLFISSQSLEFSSRIGVGMNPSIFIKQPWGKRRILIDFSDNLLPGDSIASIDSVAAFLDGVDKTTEIIYGTTLGGNKVYVTFMAGTSGNTYNIRFRLVSTNGDNIEDDLDLIVREKT